MTKSNLSITETKNGVSIKKKSNTLARRIESDASYERTRENNAEFGRALKASSLFSDAFRLMIPPHIRRDVMPRLQAVFMKVIQADAVNERGLRQVAQGDPDLLHRFEFNSKRGLKRTLIQDGATIIDRAAGTMKVEIPAFSPLLLEKPQNATHLRLTIGGAAIDFGNERISNAYVSGEHLLITKAPFAPQSLEVNVEAGSTHPLFMVMGIEFFELLHGRMTSFRNRAYDAVQVLAVSPRP